MGQLFNHLVGSCDVSRSHRIGGREFIFCLRSISMKKPLVKEHLLVKSDVSFMS